MRASERAVLSSHKMEDFMDTNILKEMSSWPAVRSGVDEAALKLRTSNETMATMVRFREEQRLQDRFGQQPKNLVGKLTEEQISNIFIRAREGCESVADLAGEFSVPPEGLGIMLGTARAPKLVSRGPNKKLNDMIVAI